MLTEQNKCDIVNALDINELATKFVDRLPDAAQFPIFDGQNYSGSAIRSEYVPVIAEGLQAIIASVVAQLIDAGSERDAVMENDELAQAIEKELQGWTELAT